MVSRSHSRWGMVGNFVDHLIWLEFQSFQLQYLAVKPVWRLPDFHVNCKYRIYFATNLKAVTLYPVLKIHFGGEGILAGLVHRPQLVAAAVAAAAHFVSIALWWYTEDSLYSGRKFHMYVMIFMTMIKMLRMALHKLFEDSGPSG